MEAIKEIIKDKPTLPNNFDPQVNFLIPITRTVIINPKARLKGPSISTPSDREEI